MIIVSNRLPVSISTAAGGHRLVSSSGGLATALKEVHEQGDSRWVGWLGESTKLSAEAVEHLQQQAREQRLTCVSLSASEVALYYDGYSNGVLWPLFHYLLDKVHLDASHEWRAYVQVNQRFADAIAAVMAPNDTVWIHDYQLALVPAMLRRKVPAARIGFFLHIPWPSSDVFRILPSRAEVLEGLLGADLIGFQTESYRQNFYQSASEVLGIDFAAESLSWDERRVRVGVYPIGIDIARFTVSSPEVDTMVADMRAKTAGKKIVLGVDRLDYTKGVPRRLLAIARLLEREPRLRERLHYVQLAVPTREKVDAYAELRRTVNELVSRINSHHGSVTSSPVQLLYRSVPHDQLLAMYRSADVMLVTPLRDGMNLVAKEYVAARVDGCGVLVLSEFAGAAWELQTALTVNPYDVVAFSSSIAQAMFMPEEEQRARMKKLRSAVGEQPVQKWADDFLRDLREATPGQLAVTSMASEVDDALLRLRQAPHRTLLLDYDGTLTPIVEMPSLATPSRSLLRLMSALAASGNTQVHVVTGRSQESIEPWLGSLPIWLHVEHGLRSRMPDGTWLSPSYERPDRLDLAIAIMQKVAARTRGTMVEPKIASAAFHYRRANAYVAHDALSALRTELTEALGPEVELLEGHKVLEVRLRAVNKSAAVKLALAHAPADTIALAIGDDRTDEDMFAALPETAISIRLGKGPSVAKLRFESPAQVHDFLYQLC
jgi:trehalose 6-phosphate synthase/phosphatase